MTKSEQIRELSKQGKSIDEIKEIVGCSYSYVCKVRSKFGKSEPTIFQTTLQKKIIKLSRKYDAPTIASKVGCSRQYVYKVLSNTNQKVLPFIEKYNAQDEYFTPLYAIIPIEKYLKRGSLIWCPFDKAESLYVRYFELKGHKVVYTHIADGFDFFKTEPPEGCDYIISNPPYSLKTEIFERLGLWDVPFAMLVGSAGLFAAKSRFNLFKDGIEQMVFSSRIAYMTDYDSGEVKAFPPFESSYICRGVLPQQLVFEEVDKSIIAL